MAPTNNIKSLGTFKTLLHKDNAVARFQDNVTTALGPITNALRFLGAAFNAGNSAERPAAGSSGLAYANDDAPYMSISSGSIWADYGPQWRLWTPPPVASWTKVNFAASTNLIQQGDVLVMSASQLAATPNWNIAVVPVPPTPYRVTALFATTPAFFSTAANHNAAFGLCVYSSTTHALQTMSGWNSGNAVYNLAVIEDSSPTAWSATLGQEPAFFAQFTWFRIEDDGTNRTFSFSYDGFNFQKWYTVGHTSFVTPTHIGWGVDPENVPITTTLLSWNVESVAHP